MQLIVQPDGNVRCLYDELINLAAIGNQQIRRASHVEPDADGQWQVDLSPCGGPYLGPFSCRSAALKAEREWLEAASFPAGILIRRLPLQFQHLPKPNSGERTK